MEDVSDRVDYFPANYSNNPPYWKNFVDYIAAGRIIRFDNVLREEYNVIYISDEKLPEGTKIIFNSREDLIYFKLKWS